MNNSSVEHIEFKDIKICDCECHIKGKHIMHCFPCCEHCYEKYINEDYTLDVESFKKLQRVIVNES